MTVFVIFLFLAAYNAGCMTTLQLQHYGIYPFVGPEAFAGYMQANNRAAVVPTIVPALLLLVVSVILTLHRPAFVWGSEAAASMALNLIALASTFLWQRPLQGQMAVTGYDAEKVRRLIATNWIRTAAHLLIALLAVRIVARVISANASMS